MARRSRRLDPHSDCCGRQVLVRDSKWRSLRRCWCPLACFNLMPCTLPDLRNRGMYGRIDATWLEDADPGTFDSEGALTLLHLLRIINATVRGCKLVQNETCHRPLAAFAKIHFLKNCCSRNLEDVSKSKVMNLVALALTNKLDTLGRFCSQIGNVTCCLPCPMDKNVYDDGTRCPLVCHFLSSR